MNPSDPENLRAAAEELHRELRHQRDTNIKAMTMYLGFCALVLGWDVSLEQPLGNRETIAIACILSVFGITCLWHLEAHARAYARIARAITTIHERLGLFEVGFPQQWRRWGTTVPRQSQLVVALVMLGSISLLLAT